MKLITNEIKNLKRRKEKVIETKFTLNSSATFVRFSPLSKALTAASRVSRAYDLFVSERKF